MSAKVQHSSQDGEANGGLSPAKMPKLDESEETSEARIARMKEFLSSRKAPPIIRPKPKPKPKPPSVTVMEEKMDDGSPLTSPDSEDPGPVLLNPESLAQFSQIADFDFNAVVRQQMLDNTPQKDRAALSQSKGLKDRRLPANLATKVPDDYQARRRSKSYSTGDLKRKEKLARPYDATDSGLKEESEEMSAEERKKKILERSGISQASPLAALGNILKRRGSGRSKKTSQDSPILKPKPKKEKPAKDSPNMPRLLPELTSSTPSTPPKSPKGFLRRWGSKGSGRKKGKLGADLGSLDGSVDDIRSETSSISSFQTAGRDVPMETERSKSISPGETPVKENGEMDTSPEPQKEKSPEPVVMANTSIASVRSSKHDSACFHEVDVEPLFGNTSTLFDSGELESMFGKSGKNAARKSRERTPEKILEQPAAEKKEEKKEEKKAEQPKKEKTRLENGVDKVTQSTEKPSRKPAEKLTAETLAASAKPAEKSLKSSPKADIRSRLHMYESSYKSSTDAREEPASTSTPKHETTAAKKTTLLFEDEGSEVFASQSKEKEEQKTDVEKKKARLFDDELFQDDLKSEPPKKTAAKRELFSSPVRKSRESPKRQQKSSEEKKETSDLFSSPVRKSREAFESPKRQQKSSSEEKKETSDLFSSPVRKSREASESPKRQQKSSLEEENKETSDLGPSISFADEVLMATTKSSFGEPLEKPSTEEEDKSKADGDGTKKHRFGLSGLLEYDESPRPAAKKVSESEKASEDKEKQLDTIADSIFGETKATEEKQKEKEKKLDEIADSLFGDDPRHKARAGRRAKKLSTDPVVKTEMSVPMSDPLGALTEKTAVEKESEERQQKLSTKEGKAKTADLFGEEIVEVDAPSDVGSKVSSSSEQSQTKAGVSPEITIQESTPPPDVATSTREKTQVETAPEEKDKEETAKDTEKSEKPNTESRVSKVDAKDTKSPSSRIGRNRDSTAEMVKTAAEKKAKTPAKEEKKDEDGGKPSWMVELQKRKGRKKSEGEEKKIRATATSASKDKDSKEVAVPEWQKRAIERRKKAAEASKSSPASSRLGRERPEKTSASSKLETSPRTGRRVSSEAATAASPKSGRRSPRETDRTATASPRTGRRSPRDTTDTSPLKTGRRDADTSPTSLRTGRRSPRDKEESSDSAGRKSPARFRSKYKEELEREKAEKEKAATVYKPTLPKKPADIAVDSKSSKVTRKPSMEKKSSKIEITTRKVARSSEKEEKEEQKKPSFTDDVQSPKREPVRKSEEAKSDKEETKESSKTSNEETKTDKKSQSEPKEDTDDVFSSEKVESSSVGESKREDKRSPSPKVLTKTASMDSGNSSRRSSVSSETTEQTPYRSRNLSHSRSPTPTLGQPPPGPMKPDSSRSVPEWKKKLMERKMSGEVVKKSEPVVARRGEKEVPPWKKELMAKKRSKSPEFTSSVHVREVRSSTVSTTRPSLQSRGIGSARSGRADKKKKEEPAFMKEFQLKKQRSTARET